MTTQTLPMMTRAIPPSDGGSWFMPSTVNSDARTIDVIWTTGAKVLRYFPFSDSTMEEEVVVSGANLNRLNAGASVLNSHDDSGLDNILGVVERAWLNKEKTIGYATLRFSERDSVEPYWQDVKSGIIRHISMGYSVDKAEVIDPEKKGDNAIFRVTRFTPLELSLVAVPADAGAHVRSAARTFPCTIEDRKMSDENVLGQEKPEIPDVTVVRREYAQAKKIGAIEAVRLDRARVTEIDSIFAMSIVPKDPEFQGIRSRAIDEGWTPDSTRAFVMDMLDSMAEPVFDHSIPVADSDMGMNHIVSPTPRNPVVRSAPVFQAAQSNRRTAGRVEVVRDQTETMMGAVEKAFLRKANVLTGADVDKELREHNLLGLSCTEMGRKYFDTIGSGHAVAGKDSRGVATAMLQRGAASFGATDFPGILANVATLVAKKGYQEANVTYREWANIGTLPDFRPATIAGLGAFSDLDKIPRQGGPYYQGFVGESYEVAQLSTYGKTLSLSREALVNDDLGEFSNIGRKMGAAAARTVNSVAYAALTGNQTMSEDGTACFIAGHGNYVAQGSGAAPSITTLNAAEVAMALQTGPAVSADSTKAYLNLSPSHLLVPMSLSATARILNTSIYDPAGTTASVSRRDAPNIWQGRLQISVDAALGGSTATGWYLLAGKGNASVDTVTVYFLEGSGDAPFIEEVTLPNADGVSYKVRIDVCAIVNDFRGVYYNYGA